MLRIRYIWKKADRRVYEERKAEEMEVEEISKPDLIQTHNKNQVIQK